MEPSQPQCHEHHKTLLYVCAVIDCPNDGLLCEECKKAHPPSHQKVILTSEMKRVLDEIKRTMKAGGIIQDAAMELKTSMRECKSEIDAFMKKMRQVLVELERSVKDHFDKAEQKLDQTTNDLYDLQKTRSFSNSQEEQLRQQARQYQQRFNLDERVKINQTATKTSQGIVQLLTNIVTKVQLLLNPVGFFLKALSYDRQQLRIQGDKQKFKKMTKENMNALLPNELRHIALSNYELEEGLGKRFADLPKLQNLELRNCYLSGQFVPYICQSASLSQLTLSKYRVTVVNCGINDNLIIKLSSLRSLKQLKLGSTSSERNANRLTSKGFESLIGKVPKSLTMLDMVLPSSAFLDVSNFLINQANKKVGDKEVEFIVKNFPNLQQLQIGKNLVTDSGARCLITNLNKLRILRIVQNENIRDKDQIKRLFEKVIKSRSEEYRRDVSFLI